jgi:hypothetical protein
MPIGPLVDPALLVPVAIVGTNGLYKPGLMAFFPPVQAYTSKITMINTTQAKHKKILLP